MFTYYFVCNNANYGITIILNFLLCIYCNLSYIKTLFGNGGAGVTNSFLLYTLKA